MTWNFQNFCRRLNDTSVSQQTFHFAQKWFLLQPSLWLNLTRHNLQTFFSILTSTISFIPPIISCEFNRFVYLFLILDHYSEQDILTSESSASPSCPNFPSSRCRSSHSWRQQEESLSLRVNGSSGIIDKSLRIVLSHLTIFWPIISTYYWLIRQVKPTDTIQTLRAPSLRSTFASSRSKEPTATGFFRDVSTKTNMHMKLIGMR